MHMRDVHIKISFFVQKWKMCPKNNFGRVAFVGCFLIITLFCVKIPICNAFSSGCAIISNRYQRVEDTDTSTTRFGKIGTVSQNGIITSCQQIHIPFRAKTVIIVGQRIGTVSRGDLMGEINYRFDEIEHLYNRASKITCPFFRRRASDIIDGISLTFRFLLIRHKTLIDPFLGEGVMLDEKLLPDCPGCQSIYNRKSSDQDNEKLTHLDVSEIANLIKHDWGYIDSHSIAKGSSYYITGKLNSRIYRNDCLFNGPDPDMPVRGLRKYLAAASHLFDHSRSYAKLIGDVTYNSDERYVEVRWEIGGVLMLPWRPKVKPWSGKTKYYLDENGLIHRHEESWDISLMEAFIPILWPSFAEKS